MSAKCRKKIDISRTYNKLLFIFSMTKTMKKKNNIIGRSEECKRLDRCMRSNSAQLVVVYGRRRVGKTFLINEFFENKFAFKLTGVYGQKRKEQLQNFTAELNRRSLCVKLVCDISSIFVSYFTFLNVTAFFSFFSKRGCGGKSFFFFLNHF